MNEVINMPSLLKHAFCASNPEESIVFKNGKTICYLILMVFIIFFQRIHNFKVSLICAVAIEVNNEFFALGYVSYHSFFSKQPSVTLQQKFY
jgi:hypothetical protein